MRSLFIAFYCCSVSVHAWAQESPQRDPAELEVLRSELAAAQKLQDEAAVQRLAAQAIAILGEQAGIPEVADQFREVPPSAKPLAPAELPTAFDPYLEFVKKRKWWTIGLDPGSTNHLPRELATIIEGCLAARSVNTSNAVRLLKIAQEAGDFLVWAQDQGGTGVIPFPAVRNGKGRPFEVAERFLKRVEQEGKLDQVVRNGWAVEDFGDGGLQFDNGLAGAALVRLYETTGNDQYWSAAVRAAEWAMLRPVVPNWNYNSFSIFLLAEVYRVGGNSKYLAAAKTKFRLGVLPGQLTEGPRMGRWADAHNVRPAYHYIMIRGSAALAAAMPENDPDLPVVVESLRLALLARNPDFQQGVFNADSSLEALIRVKRLPSSIAAKLTDCQTDEALSTLERYAAAGFRARRTPVGPGAWGLLLEYRHSLLR